MTVQRLQRVNDFFTKAVACGNPADKHPALETLLCVSCALQEVPGGVCDYRKGDGPWFSKCFPHLVESLFLPQIRDFTAQPQLSFFAPCPRSSFDECRGSAGIGVSQSVVRFWIPYFWITSTPTSQLTIYRAPWIGWRKKYMAWQKNRIIGVGTDLMSKTFWNSSYGNLSRTQGDLPVFKFKFTLVCL